MVIFEEMSVGSLTCHKMKTSWYKTQHVIKQSVKLWVLFTGLVGIERREISVGTGAITWLFDEAELRERSRERRPDKVWRKA